MLLRWKASPLLLLCLRLETAPRWSPFLILWLRLVAGPFTNCSCLENVAVPDRVTIIHRGTFWDCGFLERVTIAGAMTEIGDCAFASRTWLKNMTIPDSVAMPLPIAAARKTSQFLLATPHIDKWVVTPQKDWVLILCGQTSLPGVFTSSASDL